MKKLIALCLLLPTALMSEPSKHQNASKQHPQESSKAIKTLKVGGVLILGGSLIALGVAADHIIKQNDHIIWQNEMNQKRAIKIHALTEALMMHPDIIYDKSRDEDLDEHNQRIISEFEKIKANLVAAYGQYSEGSNTQRKTKEKIGKVQRAIDALKEAFQD